MRYLPSFPPLYCIWGDQKAAPFPFRRARSCGRETSATPPSHGSKEAVRSDSFKADPVGTLEIYAQCRWVQRWGGLATSESWKKWRPAGICPELPPAEGPETVKVFCLGSFLHLRKLTSCRIRRRSNFAAWEHFKLRFDVDIHYGDILDVEPQLHGDRYAYVYIYIYTYIYIYISTTSIGMGDIMYSNNHNKGASGP